MNFDNSEFTKMRMDALQSWASAITIPGLEKKTFLNILTYLLTNQNKDGSWVDANPQWRVVVTSVILRALAAMAFRETDTWDFDHEGTQITGGVKQALEFIFTELQNKSVDNVGEDIWDTCQALLAVAAFGKKKAGQGDAEIIKQTWGDLYKKACKQKNRWSGPAYLAAMADVLSCYSSDPSGQESRAIEKKLFSLESQEKNGAFYALQMDENINRWTTALVLRTLCGMKQPKLDLIERSVRWLLKEFKKNSSRTGKAKGNDGFESNPGEAPMYIARVLEGLCAAKGLVGPGIGAEIDGLLEQQNARIDRLWGNASVPKTGTLKAYAAVSEYLAALVIPAPVGLIYTLPGKPPDVQPDGGTERNQIFIVHGRDTATRNELQLHIQNVLKRKNPIILADEASGGRAVIEKFEEFSRSVGLVFVLLTPDDEGRLIGDPNLIPRARQNVILELGYFLAKLGRTSGRVVLLKKGSVEIPSDLAGLIPIDISNGIKAAGVDIQKELDHLS